MSKGREETGRGARIPIPQRIGLAYEKWIGHVNPGEPGFVRAFP